MLIVLTFFVAAADGFTLPNPLENVFVLPQASLKDVAYVYRMIHERLVVMCDNCFADATDFNERRECNELCVLDAPVTLEQVAQVHKDALKRFRQECADCYYGRDWGESRAFCAPCEALATPPAAYEWSLSMSIWLSYMPLETKKTMADFLAKDLFVADNSFFRANEDACVNSMTYCVRTYGRDVLNCTNAYDNKLGLIETRNRQLVAREAALHERIKSLEIDLRE